MELFDFINSINYNKKPLLDGDEKAEKCYLPYMVNRCFSFYPDTIFHSNEMNLKWEMDKKMQFDFYRLSVRKRKRFASWIKKEKENDIEIIKKAYNYTNAKAIEVLNILGPGDIEKIKFSLDEGGNNNKV